MRVNFQRRLLPGRVHVEKRFPQDSPAAGATSDDSNIPGPFTFTVTVIRPPSPVTISPVSTLPPTFISAPVTSPTANAPSFTSEQVTTSTLVPTPSVSVITSSGSSNDIASTSGPALPTGAIVGIVIAVILIFLGGIVFAIRKRSLTRRLRMRGWATKRVSSPSFLWIEPRKEPNLDQSQHGPSTISSFGTLATQTRKPSVARGPPVPTLPSKDQGGYTGVPRTPLTVPPAPAPHQFTETAIVISTFIPTLSDELPIVNRETVRLLSVYDDGWAYCSNARGEAGMVPLECLARRGVPPVTAGGRSRVSSLSPPLRF